LFILCIYCTFGQLCIVPLELAASAGNLASLCFTLCLTFCGIIVGPNTMPGYSKLMYRVSPFSYFVDGWLSNDIGNTNVESSQDEILVVSPLPGIDCEEYLGPYIAAAGTGYLL
jgi:ATP-binding cassette subfamily G (WHITE) protein 2 (PDR)